MNDRNSFEEESDSNGFSMKDISRGGKSFEDEGGFSTKGISRGGKSFKDEKDSNGFSIKNTSSGGDGVKINEENLRRIPKVTKNLERTKYFPNDTKNNPSEGVIHQSNKSISVSSPMPESYSHGR